MSFDERIERLKSILRGWVNYFRLGSIYGKLKKMDEWIRNRPRGVHSAIASGMIGRNPKGRERISSVWESHKVRPIHGQGRLAVGQEWEDGQ